MALQPINNPPQYLPGMEIYKYVLLHWVGAGSFGEVWVADDRAINHEYAIKILDSGLPIHERLQEAQIGHGLDHNNLVRVHQADVVPHGGDNVVIIAMDYMPEGSITTLANPSHFLTLPDVLRLGQDILRGLEYLHSQDMFHNDIKPENVLIGPQGQGMLTDYGIVGITVDGAPIPPPNFYMLHAAPEVIQANEISIQTDIYQVGLTLFRMLVGLDVLRQKFQTLGEATYYEAVDQSTLIRASDFPAYVPSRLRRIILKATSADQAVRYQTPLEMRRDLERLNYAGYWTITPTGEYIGRNGKWSYRFDQVMTKANIYNLSAYRLNGESGRETRINDHCYKAISNTVAKTRINRFMKAVVEGL